MTSDSKLSQGAAGRSAALGRGKKGKKLQSGPTKPITAPKHHKLFSYITCYRHQPDITGTTQQLLERGGGTRGGGEDGTAAAGECRLELLTVVVTESSTAFFFRKS